MGKRKSQGDLTRIECLVLTIIKDERGEAYGTSIRRSLAASRELVSLAGLYAALSRLEQQGYVKSRMGEPLEERGGRARRYFSLTGAGATALDNAVAEQEKRLELAIIAQGGVA